MSLQARHMENKDGRAESGVEDSDVEWSTSFYENGLGTGEQIEEALGSKEGMGNINIQTIAGSRPMMEGIQESGERGETGLGQEEVAWETTPMEILLNISWAANVNKKGTQEANGKDDQALNKSASHAKDMAEKVKGMNLLTWKRMAKVEAEIIREGVGGKALAPKRKIMLSEHLEGEDTMGKKP
jgi:hypothetical protein